MRVAGLLAVLLATVAAEPVFVSNGAICENKATGFLVIDNTALTAVDSIVYKDTSEDECLKTCSQNRDQFGRSILCSSFVYDHISFSCTIYKDKSKPVGQGETSSSVGKRYFEKVCLGEEVPMHCADTQFIRVDDNVLVGFAEEVSLLDTLEECVAHCAKNATCKSAMYFYEERECIVNSESALTKPEGFNKEENDKVIYFQNGCPAMPANVQIDPPALPVKTEEQTKKPHVAKEERVTEDDSEEAEGSAETADHPLAGTSTTIESTEIPNASKEVNNQSKSKEESAESNEDSTEDFEEPLSSTTISAEQSTIDETSEPASTTAANEEKVAVVSAEGEEESGEDEEDSETEAPEIQKVGNDKFEEKSAFIKFKKHPRNFGSKTIKAAESSELEEPISEEFSIDDFGDVEPLSQEDGEEPVEAETKPLKKKNNKHVHVDKDEDVEDDEDLQAYPNYFSEWSEWTPCTKAGERQIRRRKCINLRKCLGALMQVQNCPAVLATPAPGPIQSVRSIIGANDYDEPLAPRTVPQLPPVPTVQAEYPIWSPWLGTCQKFASGQPCNDGQMIGFESRECVAKEPTACEGPFFRYCTLPC